MPYRLMVAATMVEDAIMLAIAGNTMLLFQPLLHNSRVL